MTMYAATHEPPLPCPYCGSEAVLENNPHGGPTIYVRCTNDRCLACGPEYDQDGSKWNAIVRAAQGASQTTPAGMRELVEAIHHPKRIPVQIATGADGHLFALCSDGTIWKCRGFTGYQWIQYPALPESTTNNNTP